VEQEVHTLTWSTNRGRYCFDDPETGSDLSGDYPLSIEVMNDVWVDGHVWHSSDYDGPGCYAIADAGRPHPGSPQPLPKEPMTQESLQRSVQAARAEGMSLADALSAATAQTVGLFNGYCFISVDGQILGLCTGMRVRSRR